MKFYDLSWNPFCGCEKCSPGCDNCVAMANLAKQGRDTCPQVKKAVLNRKPAVKGATYMVCSQSDIFHPAFGFEDIDKVFRAMSECPESFFLVCTKRTGRMKEFFEGRGFKPSSNIFLGVSAEDNAHMGRADDLLNLEVPFRKWICLEPLLEEIDFSPYSGRFDWVFVSAERGENRRPCEDSWIEKIIASAGDVPCFVNLSGSCGDDFGKFPEPIRARRYAWPKIEDIAYIEHDDGYGYVRKMDGHFLLETPTRVYSHFASRPMWEYCDARLISMGHGTARYELNIKKPIPRPPYELEKGYWYQINKMQGGN